MKIGSSENQELLLIQFIAELFQCRPARILGGHFTRARALIQILAAVRPQAAADIAAHDIQWDRQQYLLANGYPRVQASTDVDNVAMRRALERAGYAFEGVQRAFMPEADRRVDYALYALTAVS